MHRYTMPNGRTDEQPATAVHDRIVSGPTAGASKANAALVLSVRPGPTLEDAKRQADLLDKSDDELRSIRRACLDMVAESGKPRHEWRAACCYVLLKSRGAL